MALRAVLNATAFRNPLLRTLVPTVALAYGIQAAVAVPSIIGQTERFYDLSGSLTYLSCTAASLYLPTLRARLTGVGAETLKAGITTGSTALGNFNWRQLAISAAVGMWATRLGSYLFSRITSDDGKDSRFDEIRTSPPKFFVAFFAQATWVSLCLLPIMGLNSLPTTVFTKLPGVTATDIAGVALFVGGFLFEVTADMQKNKWVQEKKEKKHSEEFLTRGLWGKSRHPNYFGEITLWTGMATLAGGVLASNVGQNALGWSGSLGSRLGAIALVAASPAFTTFLLTQVSGIPMSEGKYDKRYGDRKDYQQWKENTPVLIPKLW